MSLAPIQELLAEAESLPVDMEVETKYIRSVVESATNWIMSHQSQLVALGIPVTSIKVTTPEATIESDTMAHDDVAALAEGVDGM